MSYQPPAPDNGYPPQNSGYPAQNNGYPSPGYPGAYPAPPAKRPKGSPTLGIIAAVAAIAGVVIGSILVGIAGAQLGEFMAGAADPGFDPNTAVSEEDVLPFILGVFGGFGIYGLLAMWGLIQGIVATVLNRGRGWGIAAIVIAVLGAIPVVVTWFVTVVSSVPMSY